MVWIKFIYVENFLNCLYYVDKFFGCDDLDFWDVIKVF